MALQNIPSLSEMDAGGEFVVQKITTIGGVSFLPGDILPLDNMIRTMPHKLNQLCRIRVLRQVAAPATVSHPVDAQEAEEVVEETIAEDTANTVVDEALEKPSTADLKALSRKKLVALAKERGVSHEGDDKAIRIRIRKSYE